jgi:hypothetical protein
MRLPIVAACAVLAGCADSEKPLPKAPLEPKITQLYAPQSSVPAGEPAKICYGVENAKSVWIAPPTKELSAALARCIEVEPKTKTTYTLTVEGAEGKRVSQDVTIAVGGARAKLANVNISALQVKPGETVTICYTAQNARSVTIDPAGYRGGSSAKGCAAHKPLKTTTYVVTVTGVDGDRDQEQVTVNVR